MLRQRQTRSSSKLLEKEKKSEECHKEEDSKKTAEIEKTAVAPVKTNKKPKDHVKMQTKRVTRSMLKPSPPPKFPVASLPKELRNNTTVPVSPQVGKDSFLFILFGVRLLLFLRLSVFLHFIFL